MIPDHLPDDLDSESARVVEPRIVVTALDQILAPYPGSGLTAVEVAIREELDLYSGGFASDCLGPHPPSTPSLYRANEPDRVVWDGRRVVAILRPRDDGRMDIFRP